MSRPAAEPVNDTNQALQAKLEAQPAPVSAEPVPQVQPEPAPAQQAPIQPEPVQPAPAQQVDLVPDNGVQLPVVEATPSKITWEKTGNDTLDSVGALFVSKGVSGDKALAEYAEHGEISQETFDELSTKLGVETATLAYNQFKTAMGELKAAAQKDAEGIYESVGGKAAWDQVANWTQSLDQSKRDEYNALLKAGGIAAQLAAKDLKEQMMADPTFKSRADLVGAGDSGVAAGHNQPPVMLDRNTYSEQIRVAERRGNVEEINKLRQAAKYAMKNNPNWKVGNPK